MSKKPKKVKPKKDRTFFLTMGLVVTLALVAIIPQMISFFTSAEFLSLFEPPESPEGDFSIKIISDNGTLLEDANYDLIYLDNESYFLKNQSQDETQTTKNL